MLTRRHLVDSDSEETSSGHGHVPVVDFEVQVRFHHRKYRAKRKWDRALLRLVGIRNPLTKEYHVVKAPEPQ